MSSASRSNGRPALAISTLPPLDLDLPAAGSAWLICPDCTHTVEVIRGLVQTHKPDGRRCMGSAQVLDFDLTPAQHAARRIAAREALRPENRRYLPAAATPRPTNRSAAPRTAVLGDGRRPAVRRTAARTGQHTAERYVRTTMAAAFETAWEKVARVPVAPAAQSTAGRTPHPAQTVGWAARRFSTAELDYANTTSAARRVPTAA